MYIEFVWFVLGMIFAIGCVTILILNDKCMPIKHTAIISGTILILFVLFVLNSYLIPYEVDYEATYSIAYINNIQLIVIEALDNTIQNNKKHYIINLNEYFNRTFDNGTRIKVQYYKQTYGGIIYPQKYKLQIIENTNNDFNLPFGANPC